MMYKEMGQETGGEEWRTIDGYEKDQFAVDIERIVPKNEEEQKFFEILRENKKVVFDWGNDELKVSGEGPDGSPKEYVVSVDEFIERLPDQAPAMVFSGLVPKILENSGFTVEVIGKPEQPEA